MIKVSALYPNAESTKFDMDYYCNKHIPMAKTLLGAALKGTSVEKGLAGGAPGAPAPYVAIVNLYFDSLSDFQNAFGPQAETLMADGPNYTNLRPVIQISEVLF